MSEILLMKDIKRHFTNYLFMKWQWLGLPEPTELQYEMAEYYQHGPDRKIIEAFRGIGKSWIVGSYCEWKWLTDRDYRILILSGKKEKAAELSGFIKKCIEEFDILSELKHPQDGAHKALWGVERFNIFGSPFDIAPSCKVASATSSIVGSRAHEIIPDDIETPQNSTTVEGREKLIALFSQFENILFPNCNKVTVLGTPQSIESIYTHLVEEKSYDIRIWPARVPEITNEHMYNGRLSPIIQEQFDRGLHNEPTEPSRFDNSVLIGKESRMIPGEFSLQFMLNTELSDEDKYPLKLKDLMILDLDTEKAPTSLAWASSKDLAYLDLPMVGFSGDRFHRPMFVDKTWEKYNRKLMFIDPSGRGKDETAFTIGGDLHGRVFCLDFGGYQDGYSNETLVELLTKAASHGVTKIYYEDNFGDGMFGELLKNVAKKIYPVAIEGIKSKMSKEERILSILCPVLKQHRLIINYMPVVDDTKMVKEGSRSSYSLFHQLTHITHTKGCLAHDDRLDALAMMVKHFSSVIGVNVEAALEDYEAREKEKDMKWFMENSLMFPMLSSRPTDTTGFLVSTSIQPVANPVHPRMGIPMQPRSKGRTRC